MPHLTALRVYDNSADADPASGKTPDPNSCSTWCVERCATRAASNIHPTGPSPSSPRR